MKPVSVEEFYTQLTTAVGTELSALLPPDSQRAIGHFNVFNIADLLPPPGRPPLPCDRGAYYKVSLVRGPGRVEYADQVLDIEHYALLFATPRMPYQWLQTCPACAGYFCIFTEEFLRPAQGGGGPDELPIFQPGSYPAFAISASAGAQISALFEKMTWELASPYPYKYDLLRAHLLELIHAGQKLHPAAATRAVPGATARVAARFAELLEQQFPLETPRQQLRLRTPVDFADQLAVHVNYLNRVLKEHTGRTTSELIGGRVTQEARILLKQTTWTVSEISDSLGFREVAHFSNFFKRRTALSPAAFRR